jgi:CheY-like chemotaxis protein
MRNLNLLLVEDNILNQKLISLNLTKYGFNIDVAHNGFNAVEKFKERTYDIILMDIMMPIMDGYEATKLIRQVEKERGGKTAIIGLTANTYDSDREICKMAGMDEYMTKPFDFDEFKEILKSLELKFDELN